MMWVALVLYAIPALALGLVSDDRLSGGWRVAVALLWPVCVVVGIIYALKGDRS